MNRSWILSILIITFGLIAVIKSSELQSLSAYYKSDPAIKFRHFSEAKQRLKEEDKELFEVWESMLTGRSSPASKWTKERYRLLGLNHLFTPSGFHLSAVLTPLMKVFKTKSTQLSILAILAILLSFLPGQGALKRMVWIKGNQKIMGVHLGFVAALLMDIFFGSFSFAPLGFTYSFVFLGIIYSGIRGVGLIFWFFIAQLLISYFQGNFLSPLIIIISPILNLAFAGTMPLLLVLAYPLYDWQLWAGLVIMKVLQSLVDISASIIVQFPLWEVNTGLLLLVALFLYRRWPPFCLSLLLLSSTLNIEKARAPGTSRYDFKPNGDVIKVKNGDSEDIVYFSDGKCKRRLVRGFWWERCSPLRRSIHKRKIKRLSYPS